MKDVIYPYPTLGGGLVMELSKLRLDGDDTGTKLVDAEIRLVNLFETMSSCWQRASFTLDIVADRAQLEEFETKHGQTLLTVIASCRPTNNRQTIRLQRSDLDRARWAGEVELDRGNFRGRVELRAILTCATNGMAHRPVGFSEMWCIHFDAPASLRLAGTLKVSWCDFKSAEAPVLAKQFSDSSHVVDIARSMPEIFLNKSFEGLEPLLRDRRDRREEEQVMHDMERMSIARSVWMALLCDAMAAIKSGDEGEDPEWPDAEWQAEILRRVLPEIDKTKSERELLRLAAEDWRTHPLSADFLSRAEAVIGEIIGANKALRKAVHILERKGISR
jgi:hypothetical protein